MQAQTCADEQAAKWMDAVSGRPVFGVLCHQILRRDLPQAGTDLPQPQVGRHPKKSSSLHDDLRSHQCGEILDGLHVVAVEHHAVQ